MSNIEKEPRPKFTITEMAVDDIEPATEMRLQSWLDTYVNEEAGITREWVERRNIEQLSPEKVKSRHDRFLKGKTDGTFNAWVAKDASGKIIGSTTPCVDSEGRQRVGSIYVDKDWLGEGVGGSLMQKVVDWFDSSKPIELSVVSYNERAKAFYRKWGFEEVPDSESLFEGLMPEIVMIRKGGQL